MTFILSQLSSVAFVFQMNPTAGAQTINMYTFFINLKLLLIRPKISIRAQLIEIRQLKAKSTNRYYNKSTACGRQCSAVAAFYLKCMASGHV